MARHKFTEEERTPTLFSHERQPKNRKGKENESAVGKFLRKMKKEHGVVECSYDEFMRIIPMLMSMTYEEIKNAAKDDNNTPSAFSGLARLWLNDKYRLQLLAWYYDRKYGKAQQHIEQNTSISVEKQLTPKEAAELMRKLDEEV